MGSQFHSNLMRQIMATARHQARPPVALMGWINELDNNDDVNGGSSTAADSFNSAAYRGRHAGTPSTSSARAVQVHLQRRTSPGGREYLEYPPIANSPDATSYNLASALGNNNAASTSCGSSSLYALPPSAAASWAAAAPAAAATTRTRNGPSDDASSSGALGEEEEREEERLGNRALPQSADAIPPPTEEALPQLFQNLILTRRTRSHFAPLSPPSDEGDIGSRASVDSTKRVFWTDALDRAVMCGYAAPNHRRTEPFTFRRLLSPSSKTRDLADIAYQVQVRKLRLQRQRKEQEEQSEECLAHLSGRAKEGSGSATTQADADDAKSAQRKHDKWNQIPAFLVATVKAPSLIHGGGNDPSELLPPFLYEPIEYKPPATIRELEDYASCCAAVQNVLLSLHSEGLASKWATGDVIRTPAFRHLLEIAEDDRVVALIQVGHPYGAAAGSGSGAHVASSCSEDQPQPGRRHRRPLKGDVLVDL
jgi:nitroreductase